MFFKDFIVILPPEVENKIMYWVNKCDKEISGLGDAWIDIPNKVVRITSAFLVDQESTATETELDEAAIARVMNEAHQDELRGIPRSVKFWWHSHVNMAVFWSATDHTAMNKLSEHGWFVNIVFNKKYEKRAAISYPMKLEAVGQKRKLIQIDDEIKVIGALPLAEDITKVLDAEYDAKYKAKTYTPPAPYTNYYNRFADEYGEYDEAYPRGALSETTKTKEAQENKTEEKQTALILAGDILHEDDHVRLFFGEDNNIWVLVKGSGRRVRYDTVPTAVPMFCYSKMDGWVLETLLEEVPKNGYFPIRDALQVAARIRNQEEGQVIQ
jgi:hypothetical protein